MAPVDNAFAHQATLPTRAPLLVMPLPALVRFRRLMQYEGLDVDLQRLCVDDAYAFECLVTGHCSSDERLRRAALGLFAAYQRNTALLSSLH